MKMMIPDIARRSVSRDAAQTTQRARVGMIGLAAILLLIGLAAAFAATVSHERAVSVVGAANAEVVANMVADNAADAAQAAREPLAQLGVAPSASAEPAAGDHIPQGTAPERRK